MLCLTPPRMHMRNTRTVLLISSYMVLFWRRMIYIDWYGFWNRNSDRDGPTCPDEEGSSLVREAVHVSCAKEV